VTFDATERWFEISRQFPIGPKLGGDLRGTQPSEDVAPGQIRQAYWNNATAVVVIVSVDDAAAQSLVLPATLEPGVEDNAAIVVEAETSPLYGPITIWPRAATTIPFAVLGAAIASLQPPLLENVGDVNAIDLTQEGGLRRGREEPPLGSGAAMAIDELFDALDVLQRAPGLSPSTATKPAVQMEISLSVIMNALDVPQPRAMAIRMGKEPLTPEEADQLASAANLSVDHVLASIAPLPDELQRELQEPRWRNEIRRRATDGDEERARSRLGYQAYQLAARETGQGRELWRQRVEAVLAAENG
jgi:hypothetical protein